ncbi:endo alpha-1,4 polygalactosaminidase [Sagittula stellata]|uniref:Putative endo alpha-1,4 polygalactosaminidase n=1 Tax=Sagittula stellata (strain ATCC 700073 / DSM 11524 / E-37) TaxID=388399 RepID=A3K747_SAGS3|nr:endo alpha-1,4 polygalactosaminidase [Sagittula stellata]EBA07174.1 putative endo alpha-1,4 polygalactosaminidase [Sagittula stellata E-37]
MGRRFLINAGTVLAVAWAASLATPAAAQPTWDWQLTEPFDLSRAVEVMDLDPQNHPQADIDALKARGVKLICYVSVGTWEAWRPLDVPGDVLGKTLPDWPDERYLDIRRHDVLLPVMTDRFRRCADAGFDAVEPDNMDAHLNDSGFALTPDDTRDYVALLAESAHALGLEIGQKNAPDLAAALAPTLDFAILESCHEHGWCDAFAPYVAAGKPVFAAEYRAPDAGACAAAEAAGLSLIFKDRDLTATYGTCQ